MDNFVDIEKYESGEKQEEKETRTEDTKVISIEERKKKRPAFVFWDIGNESLKLKLTTPQVLELEKRYRKNLISMLGDEDNIPPLTTMLQVIHAAALPWRHVIKLKNIIELYDKYQEQGGTQINLYIDIYMQIFMVSGFFSDSVVEDMEDSMEKVQENI